MYWKKVKSMKKNFETPEIEVCTFQLDDILTTSGTGCDTGSSIYGEEGGCGFDF